MADPRTYNPNPVPPTAAALIDREPAAVPALTGLAPGGVTPDGGLPRPDGTPMTDQAVQAYLAYVASNGRELVNLLEQIKREVAGLPKLPLIGALVRDESPSTDLPNPTDKTGTPLLVNRWGRLITTASAQGRAAPAFAFAPGATVSNILDIQAVDARLNPLASDPVDFGRTWVVYDTIPVRAATDLFTYQVSPDRINWYTASQIFAATVGIAAQLNAALVGASVAVRMIQTAGVNTGWVFQSRFLSL